MKHKKLIKRIEELKTQRAKLIALISENAYSRLPALSKTEHKDITWIGMSDPNFIGPQESGYHSNIFNIVSARALENQNTFYREVVKD